MARIEDSFLINTATGTESASVCESTPAVGAASYPKGADFGRLPPQSDVGNVRQGLTQEKLRSVLSYDSDTGNFTWKVRASTRRYAGSIAGRPDSHGYRVITIEKRDYKAHRLAWLYVHGVWPQGHIDHINGNPSDNRIENLRECTDELNSQNKRLMNSNTSGFPGVSRLSGRWRGCVEVRGKKHYLGLFDTPEAAAEAVKAARARLHPFANPDRLITEDEKEAVLLRATHAMQAALLRWSESGLFIDAADYTKARNVWERVVLKWGR